MRSGSRGHRPRSGRHGFRLGGSIAALALAALALWAAAAAAHGIGMSQLRLGLEGSHVEGEWELHLRDARWALGLDTTLVAEAGWQDLRKHEAPLRAYLAGRLALTGDSLACPLELTAAPMEWLSEFDNVLFHVAATCPTAPLRFGIHTDLFFDLDSLHRAYFSLQDSRSTSVGVLRSRQRSVTFPVIQFHLFPVLLEFIGHGFRNMCTGPDHVLFLVALLLPVAWIREGRDWKPPPQLEPAGAEVWRVVGAFTLAHSLGLSLSFFGVMKLPEQLIETAIAFSVFAAAWNNLRPYLPGRGWAIAMALGLVHGLGFAGALNNLSLPRNARVLALAAFNVGLEVGQLAILALALPLLFATARRRWYPRLAMGVGSLAIAWLAVVWVLERGFGLAFFTPR